MPRLYWESRWPCAAALPYHVDGLAVVFGLALAVEVHGGHGILRGGVALVRRALVPAIGFGIVLCDAQRVVIQTAHVELRADVALLGLGPEFRQSLRIVLRFKGRESRLEVGVCRKCEAAAQNQQGNRECEFFHCLWPHRMRHDRCFSCRSSDRKVSRSYHASLRYQKQGIICVKKALCKSAVFELNTHLSKRP